MTKILFAILTTLFVSIMPLSAAYSQGTDGATSAGCVTIDQVASDSIITQLEAQGGSYRVVVEPELKALVDAISEVVGSPPPVQFDKAILALPEANAQTFNVIWFKDGCMVNSGRLPVSFVEKVFPRT